MIKKRDVITVLLPFPNINATLAKKPHMYICLEDKQPKKFLKCQSFKAHFRKPTTPPYQFIQEMPDLKHNPFKKPTLIDCDKSFSTDHHVQISEKLLTTSRRDISEALFGKLTEKIKHDNFKEVVLESKIIVQLNDEIRSF